MKTNSKITSLYPSTAVLNPSPTQRLGQPSANVATRLTSAFGKVVNGVASAMTTGNPIAAVPHAVGALNSINSPNESFGSSVGGVASTGLGDMNGNIMDMLNRQYEMQMAFQSINLQSNELKTDHEGKMSIIRNFRVS